MLNRLVYPIKNLFAICQFTPAKRVKPVLALLSLFTLLTLISTGITTGVGLTPTACAAELSGYTEMVTVTATGAALLNSETPNIKKAATEQALKNAVADVLEDVVTRESVDVDPTSVEMEIYSNAVNFIKSFKVLSEEQTIEMVETPVEEPDTGETVEPAEETDTVTPPLIEQVTYNIWIEAVIDTTSLRAALGKIVFADEFVHTVSLVILDLPDYTAYRTLMTSLERITMIRSISYDSFAANRYAFTLSPTGSLNSLMRRITEEVGNKYIVTGTKNSTIIIKADPANISFNKYMDNTTVGNNDKE